MQSERRLIFIASKAELKSVAQSKSQEAVVGMMTFTKAEKVILLLNL